MNYFISLGTVFVKIKLKQFILPIYLSPKRKKEIEYQLE